MDTPKIWTVDQTRAQVKSVLEGLKALELNTKHKPKTILYAQTLLTQWSVSLTAKADQKAAAARLRAEYKAKLAELKGKKAAEKKSAPPAKTTPAPTPVRK